jgi:hypothetical protein
MKTKHLIKASIALLALSLTANAQDSQWDGDQNFTGLISREGNVVIGQPYQNAQYMGSYGKLVVDGKIYAFGNIHGNNISGNNIYGDNFYPKNIIGSSLTIDLDAGSHGTKITSNSKGGSATMEFQTSNDFLGRKSTRILMRGNTGHDIEFYNKNEDKFVHFDGDYCSMTLYDKNQNTRFLFDSYNGVLSINELAGNTTTVTGNLIRFYRTDGPSYVWSENALVFGAKPSSSTWYNTGNMIIKDNQVIVKSNDKNAGFSNYNSLFNVDGKIECEEIEVKDVGADYVFKPDYNLLSLEEVEQFISTNGHLPGVPPAEETKKGVSLGEFSEKLLEKVEELTLHMIELKKENEALKEEIDALR